MDKNSNKSSLLNGSSTTAVKKQSAKTNEKSLSKEMIALLEEFSACFQWQKADKLISKINEQGKRDGLSKAHIRELIFLHFKGGIGDRQLRRLLPLELKYTEFANKKKNGAGKADIMSASDEQAGVETVENDSEASTEEDRYITSEYATSEIQEQTTRENIPGIGHTKPAYVAAVEEEAHKESHFVRGQNTASVLPKEQKEDTRNDSALIESLRIEIKNQNKKIDYLERKLRKKSPEFPELIERIRELERIERERIKHNDFNGAASIQVKNELMDVIDTLREQLGEKNELLSKNTFEGELELPDRSILVKVNIDRSTGRATITVNETK